MSSASKENKLDKVTTKDTGSDRSSSQSPQARRNSSQDHEQFEGRGEVPKSWAPEPKLEQQKQIDRANKANAVYAEDSAHSLYENQ
jgi:hypothetical protein